MLRIDARPWWAVLGVGLLWALAVSPTADAEWSGYWALDGRGFTSGAEHEGQSDGDVSLAFEPEYYREWNERRDSLTFSPFVRIDSRDSERSHVDIRELYWQRVAGNWELRVGISKVFWGVTESQHLVDIVNQTDLVENFDGEDKLGQPMVRLATFQPWGAFELYVLPGFRERTFPGRRGRLRSALVVDTDQPTYESRDEDDHVDLALRWSHVLGPLDVGMSHFRGTGRDPILLFEGGGGQGDDGAELRPFYEQIRQSGLDVQATLGSWLLKLEAIHRDSDQGSYLAATGGFEFTIVSPFGRGWDLGLLAEYLWDERGDTAPVPFADDLFIGARLAINDVQSTEILAGAVVDNETGGSFVLVEASRRLFDDWKLEAEVRALVGVADSDPLASLRREDHVTLRIARYF